MSSYRWTELDTESLRSVTTRRSEGLHLSQSVGDQVDVSFPRKLLCVGTRTPLPLRCLWSLEESKRVQWQKSKQLCSQKYLCRIKEMHKWIKTDLRMYLSVLLLRVYVVWLRKRQCQTTKKDILSLLLWIESPSDTPLHVLSLRQSRHRLWRRNKERDGRPPTKK